jgi:hypothetical protein
VPLPWGMAIVGSTILFRTILTLPLAIQQRNRISRYHAISPILKAWDNTANRLFNSKNATVMDSSRQKIIMVITVLIQVEESKKIFIYEI